MSENGRWISDLFLFHLAFDLKPSKNTRLGVTISVLSEGTIRGTYLMYLSWPTCAVSQAPWHPLCESLSWKAIVLSPLASHAYELAEGDQRAVRLSWARLKRWSLERGWVSGWFKRKEECFSLRSFPFFFVCVSFLLRKESRIKSGW